MQLASVVSDVTMEVVMDPEATGPLPATDSTASSSCAVDFTKLEGQTIILVPDEKIEFNSLDNDMHEEDDEHFDNEAESFDNDNEDNDDDDIDAQGGRSSRGKWTAEEDETLREAVQRHSGRNWKKISDCLEGRTDVQCLHRWQKVLRPGLIKGPWTKEVCRVRSKVK